MNTNNPLVSVIVPTRNSERTLRSCLESIRAQHYTPIELVVIDNESSDRTLEIAGQLADLTEFYGPERSAQRNRGAHLAHGQYLLFIDSDMTLAPEVIIECVAALHESQAWAAIVPEVSIGEGFLSRCRALERSCYVGDDNVEAARFYSRAAFQAVGGFDESLVAFEDWDLSMRAARGSHLPRATSYISHDEGRLRLRAIFDKKRYYAASLLPYWRKHGATLGAVNIVFRPAFLRNWRRLLTHPLLTVGVLSLKSLEAAAFVVGLVEALAAGRSPRQPKPRAL